jgi:hypothetical protein
MGTDDAGKAVAVGDGHRLDAEDRGLCQQLFGRAGTAHERKVRRALELGISRRHAKIP